VSTAFEIALDLGQSGATDPALRKMLGPGGARLGYSLYRNAARTLVWGNTTGTGGNTQGSTGNGSLTSFPVYARIPAQTIPPAGTYSDVVGFTVQY